MRGSKAPPLAPKEDVGSLGPAEWTPADPTRRAELAEIFPRPAPVEADFGCGEGAFILGMARRHPERNFLATERLLGRARNVCAKAQRDGLTNVRLSRLETAHTVKHLLPLESLSVAHILFPDPWPKRHHHNRRLVQEEFLIDLRAALTPGGEVRLKTDDYPYFLWMEKIAARVPGFERLDWPVDEEFPITGFEQHYLTRGLPIHRARLRKV